MFTQGFITVVHNDPAAPQDHCGICRIRPQDFCLKVWCSMPMSHHISIYYKNIYAYCRQFAQLFPPGQAFLDHVFRSLKETVSRESECNKVDDLKDLDCGFLVYLSNQNVYFTVVKPVLIFVNLGFLFLFLILVVRKHRLQSAHDRMTECRMPTLDVLFFRVCQCEFYPFLALFSRDLSL